MLATMTPNTAVSTPKMSNQLSVVSNQRGARHAVASPRIDRIRAAIREAMESVATATEKAFIAGLLLLEEHDERVGSRANQHSADDDKFGLWIESTFPEVSRRTAYNWMKAAANLTRCSGVGPILEVEGKTVALSNLLTMPEAELSDDARTYRQQWFDFTKDVTIKDAMDGVFAGGDKEHRITRAFNGKNAKGSGGSGNRKNFPGFTAVKLRHITTFVTKKLTANEQSRISSAFSASLQKWPAWLLKEMAETIKAELKLSEEERAGRKL